MEQLKQMYHEANFSELTAMITTLLWALGMFYVGMAEIWDWPMAAEIMQSIKVIISFIAATLGAFTGYQLSKKAAIKKELTEGGLNKDG